jgi:hypothetical protein
VNFCKLVSLQRRNATAAGDAISVCKREVSHVVSDAAKARAGAELRSAWTLRLRSGQAREGARPHTSQA